MSPQPLPMLALALALSSLGLLGGPLILSLGRGRALTSALVEGLTLGLVPTMVLLRLLPHVADELGGWAFVLTGLAFFALRGFDHAHHRAAARVGRAFIYTALLFHSFTDGVGLAAAIAASAQTIDLTLTLAFVVHRLPEGLFIATTLLPSYGTKRTLERIGGLIAATILGGSLGGLLLPHLPERIFDTVVALGLGAMLQLVVHSHADRPSSAAARGLSALALIGGVAIALGVPAPHDLLRIAPGAELPMMASLVPLLLRTAPAFVAGVVLESLLGMWPAESPVSRGQKRGGVLRALAFGASVPLGPAGVAPAIRGLVRLGATRRAIAAVALAASTLRLDALLLSVPLLGLHLSLVRALAALLIALGASLAIGSGIARSPELPDPVGHPPAPSPSSRFIANLVRAIDQRGAWLVVALLAASALEASLGPQLGAAPILVLGAALLVTIALQVPLVALLPVALVLTHKGLPVAHALALLVVGPAANRALVGAVSQAGGVTGALPLVGILTTALVILVTRSGTSEPLLDVPSMHALLLRPASLIEWAAAALVVFGVVLGLARLGPRLWLGQLGLLGLEPHGPAEHESHAH